MKNNIAYQASCKSIDYLVIHHPDDGFTTSVYLLLPRSSLQIECKHTVFVFLVNVSSLRLLLKQQW